MGIYQTRETKLREQLAKSDPTRTSDLGYLLHVIDDERAVQASLRADLGDVRTQRDTRIGEIVKMDSDFREEMTKAHDAYLQLERCYDALLAIQVKDTMDQPPAQFVIEGGAIIEDLQNQLAQAEDATRRAEEATAVQTRFMRRAEKDVEELERQRDRAAEKVLEMARENRALAEKDVVGPETVAEITELQRQLDVYRHAVPFQSTGRLEALRARVHDAMDLLGDEDSANYNMEIYSILDGATVLMPCREECRAPGEHRRRMEQGDPAAMDYSACGFTIQGRNLVSTILTPANHGESPECEADPPGIDKWLEDQLGNLREGEDKLHIAKRQLQDRVRKLEQLQAEGKGYCENGQHAQSLTGSAVAELLERVRALEAHDL